MAAGLAALLAAGACAPRTAPGPQLPLVPYPAGATVGAGAFVLGEDTEIVLTPPADEEVRGVAERWAEPLRRFSGLPLPVVEGGGVEGRSVVTVAVEGPSGWSVPADDPRARESYRLSVAPGRVALSAGGAPGVFYGLRTLRQLMPPEVEGAGGGGNGGAARPEPAAVSDGARPSAGAADRSMRPISVPAAEILDVPRFRYRGMHLDVARHFFPVDFVKRYVDLLASYKMNTFHWHLTEDQGWRIEIDRYPLLTEVGSRRKETILDKNFDPYVGDGIPYGGFYTKDEIREVVAFAAQRYVTVIPEIEMPGHSLAALAAYPELACTEGPFEVATVWGVHEDIYCPKEETFRFLEGVLTEVMELFPGPYVHVGGDEAPKRRWEESPVAREVMRREGLRDEAELQSWFIRRIEAFLRERGRRLIGWDEILEGGLAPDATVMSWRGMEGGIEAARLGHDVIMTPTSHAYFDYYQGDRASEPLAIGGFTPLEKVYAFEPVPDELTDEEAVHVLGGQGNVWTEYMKTPDHVEYMVFPRMLALAEVLWTPAEARDYRAFLSRLPAELRRLDARGVRYRVPDELRRDGPR